MNHIQTYNNTQHSKHPVRNLLFSIFCFFLSGAFSYLWVWNLFEFEYSWVAIVIAVVILSAAILGVIISFKNSHKGYFAYKKVCRIEYQ